MSIELKLGDCFDVMGEMEDNSVDTLITDPPAGINFMGKSWDKLDTHKPKTERGHEVWKALKPIVDLGILESWEAGFLIFTVDWSFSALRLLKPGATGLVWSIPRTSDLTQMGLRMAGYDIRDVFAHVFGSGFPKNYDIAKAVEGKLTVGSSNKTAFKDLPGEKEEGTIGYNKLNIDQGFRPNDYTGRGGGKLNLDPATQEAAKWDGWGTALKPAREDWIVCQKPIENTYAENALDHGVAGLWIDGGRIATEEEIKTHSQSKESAKHKGIYNEYEGMETHQKPGQKLGRWPANLILSHHPECKPTGEKRTLDGRSINRFTDGAKPFGNGAGHNYDSEKMKDDVVEIYECHEDCPVRIMNEQSGDAGASGPASGPTYSGKYKGDVYGEYLGAKGPPAFHNDNGGAARFFYCSKASRSEKDAGLEKIQEKDIPYSEYRKNYKKTKDFKTHYPDGSPRPVNKMRNSHPCVKPIDLMRYLARITKTPEGGVVLDPFLGSGSTGIACVYEKRDFIGIEMEEDYFRIAELRIEHHQKTPEALQMGFDEL